MRRLVPVVTFLCACAPAVAAQSPTPAASPQVRLGGGAALGSASLGGSRGHAVGPVAAAQAGFGGTRLTLILDATLQPFAVQNPARSEAYRALFLLPSVELQVAGAHVRAGAGIAGYTYSGADVLVANDTGPAIGAAIGRRGFLGLPKRWGVEAAVRVAASSDFELGAALYTLQLVRIWD